MSLGWRSLSAVFKILGETRVREEAAWGRDLWDPTSKRRRLGNPPTRELEQHFMCYSGEPGRASQQHCRDPPPVEQALSGSIGNSRNIDDAPESRPLFQF